MHTPCISPEVDYRCNYIARVVSAGLVFGAFIVIRCCAPMLSPPEWTIYLTIGSASLYSAVSLFSLEGSSSSLFNFPVNMNARKVVAVVMAALTVYAIFEYFYLDGYFGDLVDNTFCFVLLTELLHLACEMPWPGNNDLD